MEIYKDKLWTGKSYPLAPTALACLIGERGVQTPVRLFQWNE
jgi:hypothetical protein